MGLLVAILVLAFVAATGPPATPPPMVGGVFASPPPAWVEAGRPSVWAGFGSYCWSSPEKSAACVDMIPPTTRSDLVRLQVAPGTTVRLHLRFAPRSVGVYRLTGTSRTRLPAVAGRTISWRARVGIIDVEVTSARGSASYLVRLSRPTA